MFQIQKSLFYLVIEWAVKLTRWDGINYVLCRFIPTGLDMFRVDLIDAVHVDAIRRILLNRRERHCRQCLFLTIFSLAIDAIYFMSSPYVFVSFHLFYNLFYFSLFLSGILNFIILR